MAKMSLNDCVGAMDSEIGRFRSSSSQLRPRWQNIYTGFQMAAIDKAIGLIDEALPRLHACLKEYADAFAVYNIVCNEPEFQDPSIHVRYVTSYFQMLNAAVDGSIYKTDISEVLSEGNRKYLDAGIGFETYPGVEMVLGSKMTDFMEGHRLMNQYIDNITC